MNNMTSIYTVLITGANRGIGLGLVKKLLQNNYQVLATCKSLDQSLELQKLHKHYPEALKLIQLDITNTDEIEALKRTLKNSPIDILINNAGVFGGIYRSSEELNTTEYLNIMNTNAVFPMLLSLKLMDNILTSKKKTIIAISSIFGSLGYIANLKNIPNPCRKFSNNDTAEAFYKQVFSQASTLIPYSYSKSAINIMLANISLWFHDKGLKTLLIHPGNVATDMTEKLPDKQYRISIEESTSRIVKIINDLDNYRTASFIDYKGNPIDDLLNSHPDTTFILKEKTL